MNFQILHQKCEICGKPFTANKTKNPTVTCSPECKRIRQSNLRLREHKCVICGKIFESQNKIQPTCSMKCGKIMRSEKAREGRQRVCEICGNVFDPKKPTSPIRTCSIKCGKALLSQTNMQKIKTQVEESIGEPAKEWLEREYYSGRTLKDLKNKLDIGHTQRLVRLMEFLGIQIRSKSQEQEIVWRNNPELMEFFKKHGAKVNREMSLKRPTSIEKIMKKALDETGIEYEFQGLVERIYPCDFVICSHNLIVECDGEYWHSKPEAQLKDAKKDIFLQAKGYTILRFSDKIIKTNINQCIRAILSLIQN